jgi:hypothetical protein
MFALLSAGFKLLAAVFGPAQTALGEIMKGLLAFNDILRLLVTTITVAVETMAELLNRFTSLSFTKLTPKAIGELLGNMPNRVRELQARDKSAMGSAAGSASFMAFEEVGKKAQAQAFAMAMAQGPTPEKVAENQRNQLIALMTAIATNVAPLATSLGSSISRLLMGH